jgi:hypothetical protein
MAVHDHVHRLSQELEAARVARSMSARIAHLGLAALHREEIKKAAGVSVQLGGRTRDEIYGGRDALEGSDGLALFCKQSA